MTVGQLALVDRFNDEDSGVQSLQKEKEKVVLKLQIDVAGPNDSVVR